LKTVRMIVVALKSQGVSLRVNTYIVSD
jgi:hypothetical protein